MNVCTFCQAVARPLGILRRAWNQAAYQNQGGGAELEERGDEGNVDGEGGGSRKIRVSVFKVEDKEKKGQVIGTSKASRVWRGNSASVL